MIFGTICFVLHAKTDKFCLKLGFRRYSLPKQGHKTKQTKHPKQNET